MLTVILTDGSSPVTLFDEAKPWPPDWCREGFNPKPQRQFQNKPLLRGAAPFMADRLNMYGKWDFTVTHSFKDAQSCGLFIAQRPAIARTGGLQIIFNFSGNTWRGFYKNVFLTVVEPVKVFPVSADYHYTLLLNSLYSNTP